MAIPIRNVWLLQLFASHLYRIAGAGTYAVEQNPEQLPDLVGRILQQEVTRRLYRGLSVGFRRSARDLSRVRGRIDVLKTERRGLGSRGQVHCRFDEVVTDIPSNRLVRAALLRGAALTSEPTAMRFLADQLGAAGVQATQPPLATIPEMHRQRLLVQDRYMIAAAELMLRFTLPTTDYGGNYLPSPDQEDIFLRKLFEHAVYGFYRHTLVPEGWSVTHGQKQTWRTTNVSAGMPSVLPTMELDIVLLDPRCNPSRRLVIDTKFTNVIRIGRHGKLRLHSGYIYQIYSYLMSQEAGSTGPKSEGVMLHPVVDGYFDEEAVIDGHRIRFTTVDLAASAEVVMHHLRRAITPVSSPAT